MKEVLDALEAQDVELRGLLVDLDDDRVDPSNALRRMGRR